MKLKEWTVKALQDVLEQCHADRAEIRTNLEEARASIITLEQAAVDVEVAIVELTADLKAAGVEPFTGRKGFKAL